MLTRHASVESRRRHARGMSLVELMVGVAVGLFVVAGATVVAAGQLSDNRRLLLETQIHQDLRSASDIITREIRRIGYSSFAENGIWTPAAPGEANGFAPLVSLSPTSVEFKYRRSGGVGQEGPFGFRLQGSKIQTRLAVGGWQDLTDFRTVKVTDFSVSEIDAPASRLPCPKLCPDGTQNCWPQVIQREFRIVIKGEAVSDPSVEREIATNVRLRNDYVKFNTAPGICPA